MKKYSQSHEWIDPSNGKVGVTAHALELLGEIVFLELPEPEAVFAASDVAAVIESHKAASDIYAPVGGKITETNTDAADAPEDIPSDQDVWLFTLTDIESSEIENLMDQAAYDAFLASEA